MEQNTAAESAVIHVRAAISRGSTAGYHVAADAQLSVVMHDDQSVDSAIARNRVN
jgi:hypothetical protein